MTTTPRKAAPSKRVPANAPKPQDHKPKKSAEARKAEADGYATIELQCGVTLRIPLGDNMPLAVIEILDSPAPKCEDEDEQKAADRRREMSVAKALLGPDQWEIFVAAQPTVRDYVELGEKIGALTGN
ncbi:adenylosuccinate synthase [Mycolicibacter virginiensis]|uniref:Adenylosuccinate synthase n=1 Tax=Mycolicibacter virginiensis TaxID=1795032 RepID=A0A9X7IM70_9MYCO|nr:MULTISPECIES: hypothetical protein [Mycobacteriaceae]PQM51828.1 adenylosuccinate synthase [Mycolicibacter virginiensis]